MAKIKSIKKSGLSKYIIEFEDNIKVKVYDNVILKNNILFKKEIDSELLTLIDKENSKEEAYYKVVDYINKKIRSKKEIIDFLNKIDISIEERDNIIKRLEQNRLINDNMFARAYVQDKMLLTSDGPGKIRNDLINNNIDYHVIENLLNEIDYEDVYNKLNKLINKRIKGNTTKSNYALKQKIIFEMHNLGYDNSMINEILNSSNISKDISIVSKEYYKIYRKLSRKYSPSELPRQIYYKLRYKGFSEEEINSIDLDSLIK